MLYDLLHKVMYQSKKSVCYDCFCAFLRIGKKLLNQDMESKAIWSCRLVLLDVIFRRRSFPFYIGLEIV